MPAVLLYTDTRQQSQAALTKVPHNLSEPRNIVPNSSQSRTMQNAIYYYWRLDSVGNVVGRVNEVNQRRARLVLGWETVCRRVNHLRM